MKTNVIQKNEIVKRQAGMRVTTGLKAAGIIMPANR